MKKILVFTLLILLLIGSAWAQPTPPATPPSPESQGIDIPQASFSLQAPPSSESGQPLIATSEASARAAAPSATNPSYGATAPLYGTTAGPSTYASTYMVVPPEVSTTNKFYVPYVPSTVAGCYLGQWLPMWMDIRGWGPLYSYEWYPNGRLETKTLAYVQYPGWQKMWFNGDAPGWHTLQYYCNGWSNYIYVYVNGPPYYPPTPEPGCNAQIVVTSEYMRGYSVNVDGSYIGGDGRRGDPLDGTFAFTVTGTKSHTITVNNEGFSNTQTNTYRCDRTYTICV